MFRKAGAFLSLAFIVLALMLHGCSGSADGGSSFSGSGPAANGDLNPASPTIVDVGAVNAFAHHNMLKFYTNGVNSMSFSETGHSITGGQPWNGISLSHESGGLFQFDVNCGRKDSSGPSNWFLTAVNSNYISAEDGPYSKTSMPGEANFAVSGVVTIDGNSYDICFAQAGMKPTNLWFVGGPQFNMSSMGPIPIYTPDYRYVITPTTNTAYSFQLNLNSGGSR